MIAFKRLSNESGAEASFLSSPEKLQEAVDLVAHQLRTQYTLAYYPTSSGNGFRRIEVKVAQSGTRVRTRRGFAAEPGLVPSESSAMCEHQVLKPYPYESKISMNHGLTVYHDDFQNQASGWPRRSASAIGPEPTRSTVQGKSKRITAPTIPHRTRSTESSRPRATAVPRKEFWLRTGRSWGF